MDTFIGSAVLALAPEAASAQPMTQRTHVLREPHQHVVLTREPGITGGCGLQESGFFRIFGNGRRAEEPFEVPEGTRLVVTDVDWWIADFRTPATPGMTTYFALALEYEDPSLVTTYWVFQNVGIDDPQGRSGRSVSMTTGFVVEPGTRICPTAQVADTPDTDVLRLRVILRGYLVPVSAGGRN